MKLVGPDEVSLEQAMLAGKHGGPSVRYLRLRRASLSWAAAMLDFDAFGLADPAPLAGFGETFMQVGDDLFEDALPAALQALAAEVVVDGLPGREVVR